MYQLVTKSFQDGLVGIKSSLGRWLPTDELKKKLFYETPRPCHVPITFQMGKWLVKTVSTQEEFKELMKLRYRVFHREYRGTLLPFGSDLDRFDEYADHLVIIDLEEDAIVGSYRMISSLVGREFYSEHEFQLESFLQLPGVKLELGRACIAKEYRTGTVLGLLWRGIAQYISKVNATYVFGCASVKTTEAAEAAKIYSHLAASGLTVNEYGIQPTEEFAMVDFAERLTANKNVENAPNMSEIPSLFKTYLKAGAKIAGNPAIDLEFRCVDFFTVMKVDALNESFRKKFKIA